MDSCADDLLDRLEQTIRSRFGGDPNASYVARLHARGTPKMAQKLGEEAVETVIAALSGDRASLVGEAADLVFHLLIVLAQAGIPFAAVREELARREGLSGIDERAARTVSGVRSDAGAPAPMGRPD